MHSGGLKLTKLTYSRHEDNLATHTTGANTWKLVRSDVLQQVTKVAQLRAATFLMKVNGEIRNFEFLRNCLSIVEKQVHCYSVLAIWGRGTNLFFVDFFFPSLNTTWLLLIVGVVRTSPPRQSWSAAQIFFFSLVFWPVLPRFGSMLESGLGFIKRVTSTCMGIGLGLGPHVCIIPWSTRKCLHAGVWGNTTSKQEFEWSATIQASIRDRQHLTTRELTIFRAEIRTQTKKMAILYGK